MTSTLRRPLTFAAHERATIGDSKFSFTESDHLGWLKCDGRLLSKTEYALLYTVIGDTFGAVGDQFRLPNSQGRVPGAAGQSEDNAANPTTYVKGDISGNQLHLLTIPQMPSHNHGVDPDAGQISTNDRTTVEGDHTHTIYDPGHTHGYINHSNVQSVTPLAEQAADQSPTNQTTDPSTTGIVINTNGSHYHQMNPAGGNQYHNNMQPTIFMGNMFIFCGIYSKGIYPYTSGKGVF